MSRKPKGHGSSMAFSRNGGPFLSTRALLVEVYISSSGPTIRNIDRSSDEAQEAPLTSDFQS